MVCKTDSGSSWGGLLGTGPSLQVNQVQVRIDRWWDRWSWVGALVGEALAGEVQEKQSLSSLFFSSFLPSVLLSFTIMPSTFLSALCSASLSHFLKSSQFILLTHSKTKMNNNI